MIDAIATGNGEVGAPPSPPLEILRRMPLKSRGEIFIDGKNDRRSLFCVNKNGGDSKPGPPQGVEGVVI